MTLAPSWNPRTAEGRDRWIALAVAVLLHLLLIAAFSLFRMSEQTPLPLIEMSIGTFGTGTTVAGGEVAARTAPVQPAPPLAQPDAELPTAEQTPSDEPSIAAPEPTAKPTPTPAPTAPKPKPAEATPGRENPTGSTTSRDETNRNEAATTKGAGKTGTKGNKGGAFDLKGFEDRELLEYPLPRYPSDVQNVQTSVALNLWVDAAGNVVRVAPRQMGGNIRFVQEALRAVRSWRFSTLPPDSPLQPGQVTIYFEIQ